MVYQNELFWFWFQKLFLTRLFYHHISSAQILSHFKFIREHKTNWLFLKEFFLCVHSNYTHRSTTYMYGFHVTAHWSLTINSTETPSVTLKQSCIPLYHYYHNLFHFRNLMSFNETLKIENNDKSIKSWIFIEIFYCKW